MKRTGWLEWMGADDFRSPVRGAIGVLTSAPTERGIWCNLPSADIGNRKIGVIDCLTEKGFFFFTKAILGFVMRIQQ